jgi:hypothetical protein
MSIEKTLLSRTKNTRRPSTSNAGARSTEMVSVRRRTLPVFVSAR